MGITIRLCCVLVSKSVKPFKAFIKGDRSEDLSLKAISKNSFNCVIFKKDFCFDKYKIISLFSLGIGIIGIGDLYYRTKAKKWKIENKK